MGKKCSHGKPLTEPCLACEKLFSSDDRLRDMNAALKARVAELEGDKARLFNALSAAPVPVDNPSANYIEHWEYWHNGLRRRALLNEEPKP